MTHSSFFCLICVLASCLLGCWSQRPTDVTVFTALDREFSEPILQDAIEPLGLTPLPRYDTESTKTLGLVTRIETQKQRPECDLFWNNEILHTLRLKQQGLLRPLEIPNADAWPSTFRDPEGYWYGFAARARVLIINTEQFPDPANRPDSIHDLIDSKWPTSRAMAKPLFGTTATHAAVLRSIWEPDAFEDFFEQVTQRVVIVSGNKQVAQGVAAGEFGFGITDTDDALIELEKGKPVAIVFPDQGEGEMGTLFIPNTICSIAGSPHPENAKQLAQWLLSPETEAKLARSSSGQIPLHPSIQMESRVLPDSKVRWLDVDFEEAARDWDDCAKQLADWFHPNE